VENKDQKSRKQSENIRYMRYMGLAFQMIGIILLGAFAGKWLDGHFQTSKPYFTACVSLLAVFVSLWYSFKDLLIKK